MSCFAGILRTNLPPMSLKSGRLSQSLALARHRSHFVALRHSALLGELNRLRDNSREKELNLQHALLNNAPEDLLCSCVILRSNLSPKSLQEREVPLALTCQRNHFVAH